MQGGNVIIIFSCWRNHTYISNKVVYLYKSQAHNIACMQGKKATLRWKVVFMVPYFKGRKLIHTYIYMYYFFGLSLYYVAHLSKEKSSSFSLQKNLERTYFAKLKFLNEKFDPSKAFYRIDVSQIRKLSIFG